MILSERQASPTSSLDDFTDRAWLVMCTLADPEGRSGKSPSKTDFDRSKIDAFFNMEGEMADVYAGQRSLNNLAKHQQGKSVEFSDIVSHKY